MHPLVGGSPCLGVSLIQSKERLSYSTNGFHIHAVERAGGVSIDVHILQSLNELQLAFFSTNWLQLACGVAVDPHNYHSTNHPLLVEPLCNSMR